MNFILACSIADWMTVLLSSMSGSHTKCRFCMTEKQLVRLYVIISVVDPNTSNLDPDPEIWFNLDPKICYQLRKKFFISYIITTTEFQNLLNHL